MSHTIVDLGIPTAVVIPYVLRLILIRSRAEPA